MDFRLMDFSADVPEWPWLVTHWNAASLQHLSQMCSVFFAPGSWEAGPRGWRFKRERDAKLFFSMARDMEAVH